MTAKLKAKSEDNESIMKTFVMSDCLILFMTSLSCPIGYQQFFFLRMINNSRWPLWAEAPGAVEQASVSSWSIPVCRKSKALTVQCHQVWLWFRNWNGCPHSCSARKKKKSLWYLVLWNIHLWSNYCELLLLRMFIFMLLENSEDIRNTFCTVSL